MIKNMKTNLDYSLTISDIISTYENVVKVVDSDAHQQDANQQRAYGGVVRSVKGKLQEYITKSLIMIAWDELSGDLSRIEINSKKIQIPLQEKYLSKLEYQEVRDFIENNISQYHYGLSVDRHVFIDGKLVLGIECKAYTENAMLKRIMVDFNLLSTIYPNLSCYLFQLESQLGGDYSELNIIDYGSRSTHTIMSYFDIKLNIVTLLKGERDINNPIHKNFKELKKERLEKAKNILKQDLQQYI